MIPSIGRNCHRYLTAWLLLTLAIVSVAPAGQKTKPPKKSESEKVEESDSDQDLARWRLLLDTLIDDAKGLPVPNGAYALLDIAETYCSIDPDRSAELFTLASVSTKPDKEKSSNDRLLARRIVSSAITCDASRGSELIDSRVKKLMDDNKLWPRADKVAKEFVNPDDGIPKLGGFFSKNGVIVDENPIGHYVFWVGKQDMASADGMFRSILPRFAQSNGERLYDLDELISLAGYPFGVWESLALTIDGDDSHISMLGDAGGWNEPDDVQADSELAVWYLNVALKISQNSLQQIGNHSREERDFRSQVLLFAVEYLSPWVIEYTPDMLPVWQALGQQALALTTPEQRKRVSDLFFYVNLWRRHLKNPPTSQFGKNNQSIGLDRIEKLPEGCERDIAYAKFALEDVARESEDQLQALAQNIKDKSLQDAVRQTIYYKTARRLIEANDLDGAREFTERVSQPEERALLYLISARRSLLNKDKVSCSKSLNEAKKLAESSSDKSASAAIQLSAAAVFAGFDKILMEQTYGNAIKFINQIKDQNLDKFSISQKINSSCIQNSKSLRFDEIDGESHSSLFAISSALAITDFEGTLVEAKNLDDPTTRIRTITAMVKSAVRQKQNRK